MAADQSLNPRSNYKIRGSAGIKDRQGKGGVGIREGDCFLASSRAQELGKKSLRRRRQYGQVVGDIKMAGFRIKPETGTQELCDLCPWPRV